MCVGGGACARGVEIDLASQTHRSNRIHRLYNLLQDPLISTLALAMAILGIAVSISCAITVAVKHDVNIIKYSQPLFLNVNLLGSVVLQVAAFYLSITPTDMVCTMQPWLAFLGFGLYL